MSLRLSSLDYLGLVASRLRRDAVQSKLKLETIDTIINSVKVSRSKQGFGSGFKQVSGSGSGSRRAKMTHKKVEKIKKFHVLKCWMFSFES